jgi:organic radical activating enzyme
MTLPEQAKKMSEKVSYVSGDFKLPDSFQGICPETRETHMKNTIRCFRALRKNDSRDCFCKIVIGTETETETVVYAVEAIAPYVSCVVLQPETLAGNIPGTRPYTQAYIQKLLKLQENLLELADTRIIPQTHRMWGCL